MTDNQIQDLINEFSSCGFQQDNFLFNRVRCTLHLTLGEDLSNKLWSKIELHLWLYPTVKNKLYLDLLLNK